MNCGDGTALFGAHRPHGSPVDLTDDLNFTETAAENFGATEERATCIRQKSSRVGTGLRAVGIYKSSSRAEGAAGFGFYVSSHAEGVVGACALHAHSGWAEPLEFLPCVLEVLFSHLRFA